MLRGDEQQPVGGRDLRLEADHARRQVAFVVLIVQREIVDLDADMTLRGLERDGLVTRTVIPDRPAADRL